MAGTNSDSVKFRYDLPVDAGDIGAEEHETYIAQGAKSQADYGQNPDQKNIEPSRHTLQGNSRQRNGQQNQNETGQIESGKERENASQNSEDYADAGQQQVQPLVRRG
jgi:hypothetical protein